MDFVLVLLVVALILFLISERLAKESEGIVGGEVVYSDLVRKGKTLYSKALGISGRPDYVVRREKTLIPVEVKSGRAPRRPHRSHVMQLAAYCFLLEENFGVRVPCGYLVYGDGNKFRIDYDEALKAELILVVEEMREALRTGKVKFSPDPKKCRSCSVRERCVKRAC